MVSNGRAMSRLRAFRFPSSDIKLTANQALPSSAVTRKHGHRTKGYPILPQLAMAKEIYDNGRAMLELLTKRVDTIRSARCPDQVPVRGKG